MDRDIFDIENKYLEMDDDLLDIVTNLRRKRQRGESLEYIAPEAKKIKLE